MSETLVTRTVVVTDPSGIHARTAVAISEVVRRGNSRVTLIKNGQQVSGTDVLQILTLVAAHGEEVTLQAVGEDAEAVVEAMIPLFSGQFGEQA